MSTSPTLQPATDPAPALSGSLTPTPGPVAVLGGTGMTGRRVAARLEARGLPVRRAARSTTPRFDWQDESTWAPVLDGASAVYVAFAPDLSMPGAPETVSRLAAAARDRGVRRLVLLSGRGEAEAQRAEAMVADAFPARVVVRCAFFAQDFSESFLLDAVRSGTLSLPAGDVREPFVDLEDVADVAVEALLDDAHAGRVYELTGPRLLSFHEAVDVIATAAGREVRYQPVTMADFVAGLRAAGLPDDVVELMRYLFTEVLDGRGAHVTDGIRQVLGREGRTFAQFAEREAAAWAPRTEA
jgi:uncharacterized protein YbjT (DUF2867 family)